MLLCPYMKDFFAKVQQRLVVLYRRVSGALWFKLLRLAFIAVLLGAVVYGILNLNLFYIQNLNISSFDDSSLTNVTEEEIDDYLVVYLGRRLFWVRPTDVENDLQYQFPFIESAYVTKQIPDTLTIRIVERDPVLIFHPVDASKLFKTNNSETLDGYIIDSDGLVLDTCEENNDLCDELPLCTILETAGTYSIADTIYFAELESIVLMNHSLLDQKEKVTEYVVPENDVVVVLFEDETRAVFSLRKSIEEQIELFEYTKENLSLEGKTYKELDFRYDKPVLRV
ncbi:unnamed protein product, partial [marine sediment metagenome]